MRAETEALADRDFVRGLAESLGVEFLERAVSIDPQENDEASARERRYSALADVAQEAGLPFVASAHHADDQFETLLMALLRGSGPRGLRGVMARRDLGDGIRLIRPMLGITRAEIVAFLREFGIDWREDATNAETDRLRAGLRHGVVAELLTMRPNAGRRAARTGELMGDVVELVESRAEMVFGSGHAWERDTLTRETSIVLGEGLRRACLRLTSDAGADRLTGSLIEETISAIRDGRGGERVFDWPRGVRVRVTGQTVEMSREETDRDGG